MAIHLRLANHTFDTFEAFKEWMIEQQFDISRNPDRAPILRAGQRVSIRDLKSEYVVIKTITDVGSVLEPDPSGGFLDQLKVGQDFIFAAHSPASTRIALHPSKTNEKIGINELLITQNADVTLDFNEQGENFNRSSTLQVTCTGNVSLNTGKFKVESWSGEGNTTYLTNTVIPLSRNTRYTIVLSKKDLVYLIEEGKVAFDLSQSIPIIPSEASPTKIPSEQAVSTGFAQLNELIQQYVDDSGGFLRYSGIDPASDMVVPAANNTVKDIAYAVKTEDELPSPSGMMYALVLNGNEDVKVYGSIAKVQTTYRPNSLYLGKGSYGTDAAKAEVAISKAYPKPVRGNIVSNLDTGLEWKFNGIGWEETFSPAGDSEFEHSDEYLGVYSLRKDPEAQRAAINMCFPLAGNNFIVNSTVTNSEWKKISGVWTNTGKDIGTSAQVPNPKVAGSFSWSPTDSVAVVAALIHTYEKSLIVGDIISVEGGNEWRYSLVANEPVWTDTGKEAETSERIPNPQYITVGNYGVGIDCANRLQFTFPNANNGDCVGNRDTNTDWMCDGEAWEDTEKVLGTCSTLPNPIYKGVYSFNKNNEGELLAVLDAKFGTAPIGSIIYNLEFDSEWERMSTGWADTYQPLYTTPQMSPNSFVLGTFNYGQDWTPPSVLLTRAFPEAKMYSIARNLSTGTEWELTPDKGWVDTGKASGTTPEADPRYVGEGSYRTNPPTDSYIIPAIYGNESEGKFVTNMTTNTQWEYTRGKWVDSRTNLLTRWVIASEGSFDWELRGISPIFNGALFHIVTRSPSTDVTGIYWFANSWNTLDLELVSIANFTNDERGLIQGKEEFGFVTSSVSNNVPYGKVHGLVSDGKGNKFLNDRGMYEYATTSTDLTSVAHVYVNFESGNDDNDGLAPERAWRTNAKLNSFLERNYSVPNKSTNAAQEFVCLVAVHMAGVGANQVLSLNNVSHVKVVGEGSDKNRNCCKRLSITNSNVMLGGYFSALDDIYATNSTVEVIDYARCRSLNIRQSSFTVNRGATLEFQPDGDTKVSPLTIKPGAVFTHKGNLLSEVSLDSNVAFLNIEGCYINENGTFSAPSTMAGMKFLIKPGASLIGATENSLRIGIPYAKEGYVDTSSPVMMPGVRTMGSTSSKTGYCISDGKDLADIIAEEINKNSLKGIIVKNTTEEALREVILANRYEGMLFYIIQEERYYFFKGGIEDENLSPLENPGQPVASRASLESSSGETLYDTGSSKEYSFIEINDWDTLIEPGKYLVHSRYDSKNSPAPSWNHKVSWWWWVDVDIAHNKIMGEKYIRQFAKSTKDREYYDSCRLCTCKDNELTKSWDDWYYLGVDLG